MRIALIADMHGNLVALEGVMADIERDAPDRIVCLGDVAAGGPQPRETLDRVRELQCPVIRGNVDEWTLEIPDAVRGNEKFRRAVDLIAWAGDTITPADADYIRTFVPTLEVDLGDNTTLLLFHATPNSTMNLILATTPEEELDRMLSGYRATVMAGGHTHVQLLRRHRDTMVINPGSIGLPGGAALMGIRRPPWAEYGIVSYHDGALNVDFRRVPYDVDALERATLASDMPHAHDWIAEWR